MKEKQDLVHIIKEHLLNKQSDKLNIVSGNPEVLLNSLNNEELGCFFKRSDNIIIPDGIGITILIRMLKHINVCKIAGIEIMDEVLKISNDEKLRVYFLGATDENLELALKNIKIRYPNVVISGFQNGYFSQNSDIVADQIRISKSDILFVAMGSPRQDMFISRYMDRINCKLFMGVGGSFDLYAGKLNRAPKVMINLGLEWLYRVYKEPFRIKRLGSIPKFMLRSIKYHLKDRCSD